MKRSLPWLILAGFIGGCAKAPEPEAEAPEAISEVSVAVATVRALPGEIEFTGQFVPPEGHVARVGATLPNRIATVTVKEGDRVTAGMVVATLDTQAQTATVRQLTEAATAAQAEFETNLQIANLQLQTTLAEASSDISQAKSALKIAQADFEKVKSGSRPQEIATAQAAVRQATIARDQARRELRRVEALLKDGYVPAKDVEAARETLNTEEQAVIVAQNALDLARVGNRPEEIAAASERVKAAQDTLATLRVTADKRIATARATVEGARRAELTVKSKQSEAASAAATAETSLIRAPFDGVVTKRILNPGDESDNLTPILEITDASRGLDFVAMISPEQATSVSPGLPATITVTGRTIGGRAVTVGNADPATGLIPVRISIPTPGGIRAGTFGTGKLILPPVGNSVVVPSIAVLDRDGKSILVVKEGEVARVVPVTLGRKQGDSIAIRSGIKPGQSVITEGQYELTDGAKVRVKGE